MHAEPVKNKGEVKSRKSQKWSKKAEVQKLIGEEWDERKKNHFGGNEGFKGVLEALVITCLSISGKSNARTLERSLWRQGHLDIKTAEQELQSMLRNL